MSSTLCFVLTIWMPIAATILFALLERFTKFGRLKSLPRQVIIGAVFALTAVMATQWGLEGDNSIINVRDASPICASFAFGPVAGIISALAGGIYRLLASVLWHQGDFSAVACSISTVLIGLSAVFIQKAIRMQQSLSLFFIGLFAVIAETTHMLLIFLTNVNNTTTAYYAVSECALPMIGLILLITLVAYAAACLIRGDRRTLFVRREQRSISHVMERILVAGMAVAFLFTGVFSYVMQVNGSISRADDMLRSQLDTYNNQIDDAASQGVVREIGDLTYHPDGNITPLSDLTEKDIPDSDGNGKKDAADITAVLREYAFSFGFDRIDLMSMDGTILYSSEAGGTGKNVGKDFLEMMDGQTEFAQPAVEPGESYAVGGTILPGDSSLLFDARMMRVLYGEDLLNEIIRHYIYSSSESFRFGNAGRILVLSEDTSTPNLYDVIKPLDGSASYLPDTMTLFDPAKYKPLVRYEVGDKDKTDYMIYDQSNDLYYVVLLDKDIAMQGTRISFLITILMEAVIFAAVSLILFFAIRAIIIKNIDRVNESLGRICDGDLDVVVDVRSTKEFSQLSGDINSTVSTLKTYIEAESKRIDDELALARTIQTNALPRVFPPFPGRDEFDIYADMIPAKEVGGDFYDFFFITRNTLAFLIADVSGKGIPAALFMMTARTTLKNIALQGKPIGKVFEIANRQLYETNPSMMFVTAWMGVLDVCTGEMCYVSAGHNPPLLYHAGSCRFLRGKPNFVLAGVENMRYAGESITLEKGDRLLLYTDGVTEAKSKDGAFYGEERLQSLPENEERRTSKELCEAVIADVNRFAEGCVQADDMTVLAVRFNGKSEEKSAEKSFAATFENIGEAVAFVFDALVENGCPETTANRFRICTDEIFSNIVKYAYPDGAGEAVVRVAVTAEKAQVSFSDRGAPFDPTTFMNRELALPAIQRKPGGLGIFLVKRLMDEVTYTNENGENKLVIAIRLE